MDVARRWIPGRLVDRANLLAGLDGGVDSFGVWPYGLGSGSGLAAQQDQESRLLPRPGGG
jgi:hypothetical protein